MFEGVVTAILNKFLGSYIKNLDSSQLKLGIFGGDVALKDLEVKPDALADKNLPVRVHAGFLRNLTLKIPWTSLYTAPTIVVIEGVFLLVGPSAGFKYDEETSKKEARERKQRELEQIEERKRIEREGKPEEKSDGFVGKMVTQIIKNVEVTVKDVHIRYEDNVTHPGAPFAIGVTLEEVFARTSDTNWKPAIIKEAVQQIHKLVKLQSFSVYVNTDTRCLAGLPLSQWLKEFKDGIVGEGHTLPAGYQYVLRPFCGEAKLMLNKDAGKDMDVPKIMLDLVLKHLALCLSQPQFVDVMQLVESFDRKALNEKFLKYKASGRPKGNAKGWWKYCILAVLNEDVRWRIRMWSWKYIQKHRRHFKEYKTLYKAKLLGKSYPNQRLQELEDHLDMFNISVARNLAESRIATEKQMQHKEKKGWFSGWFGSSQTDKKGTTKTTIAGETVEISAEEKAKLYKAIGYVEDASIPELPREYVDKKISVELQQMSVGLVDKAKREILHSTLNVTKAKVETRSAAKNVWIEASASELTVNGLAESGEIPTLLISQPLVTGDKAPLFSATFEKNPLDGRCDQMIRVELQPTELTADMPTVNAIVSFFAVPEDIKLQQLQSAASDHLNSLREQGRAVVQHEIGKRKLINIDVTLHSSYVIVPETGRRTPMSDLLVIDLGQFSLKSELQDKLSSLEDASQEQLDAHAFDRFKLQLSNVQVILGSQEDDWQAERMGGFGKLHLLQPVTLAVDFMKSIIPDDIRLPKVKLSGDLPLFQISLSDRKIKQLMELAKSLPLPESPSASSAPTEVVKGQDAVELPSLADLGMSASHLELGSLSSIATEVSDQFDLDSEDDTFEENKPSHSDGGESTQPQILKFAADLTVQKVGVSVSCWKGDKERSLLDLSVVGISTEVKLHTWDMVVEAGVQNVLIQDTTVEDSPVSLLQGGSDEEKFVAVRVMKANSSAPNFEETYGSTLHKLKANVSSVKAVLQDQSLLELKEFALGLLPKEQPGSTETEVGGDPEAKMQKEVKTHEDRISKAKVQFNVDANVKELAVVLCTPGSDIATASIKEISAEVVIEKDVTTVRTSLRDMAIVSSEDTKYPKILSIEEGRDTLMKAEVCLYKDGSKGERYADLSNVDLDVMMKGAALKIVFLNGFVQKMLAFGEKFKPSDQAIAQAKKNVADMAEAARTSMKENSGARVRLDIELDGPLIIVPRNAQSDEHLEANLGTLVISNQFKYAKHLLDNKQAFLESTIDNPDYLAVIDCMTVELQMLKVTRFSGLKSPYHVLVKPMNFEVLLNRCLSDSFRGLPLIDVTGNLPAIKMEVGKPDIDFTMAFLNENLKEGATKTQSSDEPDVLPPKSEVQSPSSLASDSERKQSGDVDIDWTRIRATFKMPEVSLSLLEQSSESEQNVRVQFAIISLTASVGIKGPCTQVSASIEDAIISDCAVKMADGNPLKILFSEPGVNLLDLNLRKVDPVSPLFKTEFEAIETKIKATIAAVDVVIHRQSVVGLMEFALSLKPTNVPSDPSIVPAKSPDMPKFEETVPTKPKTMLDTIQMELEAGLTKICVTLKSKEANLASVKIVTASAHVCQNSSGLLDTKLTVDALCIDDLRGKKNGITNFIGKYSNSDKPMLDVAYQKTLADEHIIVGFLNDLSIAVCIDFLLSLTNFGQSLLPKQAEDASKKKKKTKETEGKFLEELRKPTLENKPEQTAKPPLLANARFDMSMLHIFFLEDSFDVNTRAFYLTTEMKASFTQTQEKQEVRASLPAISLHSCIYSEKMKPRAEIVSPFDMELKYDVKLDDNTKTASVTMSSVDVSVDPYTVDMMKHVAASATSALERLRQEEGEEEEVTLTSDLFDLKPINSDDWYYDTAGTIVPVSPPPGKAGKGRTSSMLDKHRSIHQSIRDRQGSRIAIPVVEELIFEVEKFQLKLENEVKGFFYPLLSVDGVLNGKAVNWSGELTAKLNVEVEIAYYNERLAVWEPLLEPVPKFEDEFTYRQWKLHVDIKKSSPPKGDDEALAAQFDISSSVTTQQNEDANETDGSTVDTSNQGTGVEGRRMSVVEIDMPKAVFAVNVVSEDILQLTISKTALQVFTALAEDWSYAESAKGQLAKRRQFSPYDIHNKTGLKVKVWPGHAFKDPTNGSGYSIAADETWPLNFVHDTRGNTDIISKSFNADQIGQHRGGDCSVSVEVEGFKPIKNVPVLKAAVLHYNLHLLDPTMTVSLQGICLVCEVEALEGQKVIRLRSPLQVKNLLPVAMEVQTVEVVGADQQHAVSTELQPETTYYPPIIQSTNCVFMLRPQSGNYNFSHPFSWKDNKKNLFCTGGDGDGFCVRMVVKKDNYDNAVPRDKPHHTLHLSPPVILHNLLPVSLSYTVEETAVLGRIEGGNKISMFKFDLNKKPFIGIMASDCGGHEWMGQYRMDPDAAKLSFFPVKAKTSTSKDATLQLGVRTVDDLSVQMYIFCQYWMVNKTMLPLQYKPKGVNHIIEHEPSCSGAVMLAFDKGSDSKKKAQIRIMDSQWSKPFSLDIAGSGGVVRCKGKEQEYEFGVKVNLTSFQLSRIVSFTPYQVISNNTLDRLFCFEGPSQVPLIVDPGQCCPLWPEGKDGEMQVSVGANDAPKSKKFIFTRAHHTLLELSGKVVALNVEVQVSESSIVIAFSPYFNGAAPVRIENNCSNFNVIPRFWQKWSRIREEADTSFMVDPGKSKIYTWINPLGTRVLAWTFDGIKGCPEYENNLSQDNHGKIELSIQSGPKKELVKVYWASFLDGLQRVLLFTNDKDVVEKATETEHVERPDLEFTFSLHGVGIALVNNLRGITAAYIGITHSGYLWESKLVKKKRFKPESYAMCRKLEMLYNDRSKAKELKLEVDFNQMRMLAPVVKNLRRTVHEGIYFQFTMSRHHFHIHGVINRIQIDNQVMENVFPTVFYPVKPPKSVAAQAAPKPFLEGSVVIHRVEQSSVRQIKYLMVLVQEISVEVDMGFIENILQVFAPDKWDDKRELDGYKKDEERVKKSLSQSSAVEAAAKGQNLFIDFLHLSPMKIHVSFSMNALGTGEDGSSVGSPVEFLTTLLKSIGVVMADVQDVELKLSYFEVCSRTMNDKQLRRSIERHYTTQALKQVYALILGLDVIGSPFGLVNNFKDGVFDLFYEPYQGAVQGPEEFAIGVAFGVRSLVSHTVGGVFGAVSKITGTLNKGIAKLTFDDEYKRDLATSKQPKNVGEGLVKGAKGLFGGIVHGVTGVVTKPFEGAKKGGVEGFFKGVGKGVIGLVARPVGGVFELASNTFQGISNTADLDAEVVRLRCPRFIGPSKVVHPYNVHNATGNFFLQAIDSGKFSRTDVYFAHSGILDKPKIVIIVTNKRVILMEEGDLEFIDKGELKSPWSTELCEIKDVVEYKPVKDPGLAIQFVLKSYKKTKGLPLFKSKSTPELEKKAFKAPNKSSREYVIRKVNEAINKFCQPSQK